MIGGNIILFACYKKFYKTVTSSGSNPGQKFRPNLRKIFDYMVSIATKTFLSITSHVNEAEIDKKEISWKGLFDSVFNFIKNCFFTIKSGKKTTNRLVMFPNDHLIQ